MYVYIYKYIFTYIYIMFTPLLTISRIPSPTFRASKMDEAVQQPPTSTSCGGWSLDPWWCLERNMKVEVVAAATQKPAIICPFFWGGGDFTHLIHQKLKSVFSKLSGILCSVKLGELVVYFFSGVFTKMCLETWGLAPYVPKNAWDFKTSQLRIAPLQPFPTR